MKYLVISHNGKELIECQRLPILEEAMQVYEKAKKNDKAESVYLTAILKEIDL